MISEEDDPVGFGEIKLETDVTVVLTRSSCTGIIEIPKDAIYEC